MGRYLNACAFLLFVAWAGVSGAKLPDELPVDGFAAIVNQRVITIGDVMEFAQANALQLRDEFERARIERNPQKLFEAARDLLIEQALIVEEFKKNGGTIPDRVVEERMNSVIFERFDNDRAKFLAALAEDQMTVEEWRERVRERIIVSIMRRQEVLDRAKVSPAALQAAYNARMDQWRVPERVRVRLIMRRVSADDTDSIEDQRQRLIRARDRVLAGEPFAEVAKEVSEDSKAPSGGDWGWRVPSDFAKPLSEVIASLPAGEVSDVIETPGALFLAWVEAREPARTRSFEEVRPELERELQQAETERLYRRWIERLRQKHFVKIF